MGRGQTYKQTYTHFNTVNRPGLRAGSIENLLYRTVYVHMNLSCDVCVTHGVPLKLEESTSWILLSRPDKPSLMVGASLRPFNIYIICWESNYIILNLKLLIKATTLLGSKYNREKCPDSTFKCVWKLLSAMGRLGAIFCFVRNNKSLTGLNYLKAL